MKSAYTRCISSVTASPIGRPGVKDCSAYAWIPGGMSTRVEAKTKSMARQASGSRSATVPGTSGRASSQGRARASVS